MQNKAMCLRHKLPAMSLNISATSYPVRFVTSEHKAVPQKMYFLPCTNQLKQSVTSWQLKLFINS